MRVLDITELLLLAALWGGSFLFMRIAAPVLGPVWLIEFRVLLAGLVLLPILARLDLLREVRRKPTIAVVLAVIALSLLSTAFAYILYFRLIQNIGSTKALTVGYLIPLFAIFWGASVLKEAVTTSMILGCSLVLLGAAITNELFVGTLRSKPKT